MSRVRAPSVTPSEQLGGTQVPLHCSGPGFCPGDAPLAQRQSNGLLIRRFWVRNPGGAPVGAFAYLAAWMILAVTTLATTSLHWRNPAIRQRDMTSAVTTE